MTFEQRETSTEQGLPVTLFLFRYGERSEDVFAYTDFEEDIAYDGQTYVPTVIGHGDIKSSGNLDDSQLEISITPNASLVGYMEDRTPTQIITLRIFQGHFGDPDAEYIPWWVGEAVAGNRGDLYYEVACQSILTALSRTSLKRIYQRTCPWSLYGADCGATRVLRARLTPDTVGENVITLADGWNGTLAVEKFQGGYVVWDDPDTGARHRRTIMQTGVGGSPNVLLLQGTTEALDTTVELEVYAGCNKSIDDCRTVHNNINNYGGQWKIPLQNPIGYVNRFY